MKVWKVLISDDDEGIHQITNLILSKEKFDDISIELINKYSAKETIEYLKTHDDIAVIILDMIMEKDDSGISVINEIRDTIKNKHIRIVIRTGQASDKSIYKLINDYEINDYKEKNNLRAMDLKTTLTFALRGYKDIKEIQ